MRNELPRDTDTNPVGSVSPAVTVLEADGSRQQVKFGYAKSETLPEYCRQCPYLTDCWGECPKNRIIRTADGEPGLNHLCRGFKKYFAHAIPEVERIAAELRKQPLPAGHSTSRRP